MMGIEGINPPPSPSWQSAKHHKIRSTAVGNQPLGNQPKNQKAISHLSNPLHRGRQSAV
jgi:hypothetical protein